MAEQISTQEAPKVPYGDRFTKELFVDGVCQVHLVNGAIKMDLLTISPNGTNAPEGQIRDRLVMSLQQFLASVEVQNKMVEQLLKEGIINKD